MKGNEQVAAVVDGKHHGLREERHAERSGVSLHLQRRGGRGGAARRVVVLRVRRAIAVAVRPPVIAAIGEDVDLFWWKVLVVGSEVVALVLRRPQLASHRMHREPNSIAKAGREYTLSRPILVEAQHRGAVGGLLDAQVAGGTHGDVHPAVGAEHHGPRPVPASPRVVCHVHGRTAGDSGGAQRDPDDAVGIGDVKRSLMKGEPVRLVQSADDDLRAVRDAVVIRVRQADDATLSRLAGVHGAVGAHGHEAHLRHVGGVIGDLEIGRDDEPSIECRSAAVAGIQRGLLLIRHRASS